MMIKSIIKFFLPFYQDYIRIVKTKILYVTYWRYLKFRLFGKCNSGSYYPIHKGCTLANARKIFVGINSFIGRPGCYIQGAGTVYIGDYVQFAPGVGILSSNHDLYDQNKYNFAPIKIGNYSWLGMNSIVTAGVVLGPRTIVAAGAVVTKSYPEGFCVLAGVPAKPIKFLDKEKFIPWHYESEFYGFLSPSDFERKRKKYLDV